MWYMAPKLIVHLVLQGHRKVEAAGGSVQDMSCLLLVDGGILHYGTQQ